MNPTQGDTIIAHPNTSQQQTYHLLERLGQGSMGITYRAQDCQTGEQVAIKCLSLQRITNWKAIDLFHREAQTLAQLNHPAIPRYLNSFEVDTESDRCFCIVQKLAPGQSLATLVNAGWHTTEAEVKQIAQQVLDILVYLQSLTPPIIHRDIKPENLILNFSAGAGENREISISLVDFGAVQNTYYSTLMWGSTLVGTFGYMAPEQFRGQATTATDLYGLGATLLFLLTHRSPADLPQEDLRVQFRDCIQVSPAFADWLEKMLEPDPSDRFATAQQALTTLREEQPLTPVPTFNKIRLIQRMGAIAIILGLGTLAFNLAAPYLLSFTPKGMCDAIRRGYTQRVKAYLQQGGNPTASYTVSSRGKGIPKSYSLLYCARVARHAEIETLLQHTLQQRNLLKETPLHREKDPDKVQQLLEQKADINARDMRGNTPLQAVLVTLNDTTNKPLAELAASKVSTLLNYRDYRSNRRYYLADVTSPNFAGKTPLHLALENFNPEYSSYIVQRLLAAGADVNLADKQGRTPLHLAVQHADGNVLTVLVNRYGVNLNAQDQQGLTPRQLALKLNNIKAANILREAGGR